MRALKTFLPALISVTLQVLVEIFSHVSTGCSSLSADSGTHPVVPLGRIGSRTRSHTLSLTVVRSRTATRSSVPSGDLRVSFDTLRADALGCARTTSAFSTKAKKDSFPG